MGRWTNAQGFLRADDAPSLSELRQFGLIFGAVTATVFGLLVPWFFGHPSAFWPWVLACVVWFQALLVTSSLRVVYRLWMGFGAIAGFVNTRIIMCALYGLVFVPIGTLMSLLGRDPLARKFQNNGLESYRIASHVRPRDHFERPY